MLLMKCLANILEFINQSKISKISVDKAKNNNVVIWKIVEHKMKLKTILFEVWIFSVNPIVK